MTVSNARLMQFVNSSGIYCIPISKEPTGQYVVCRWDSQFHILSPSKIWKCHTCTCANLTFRQFCDFDQINYKVLSLRTLGGYEIIHHRFRKMNAIKYIVDYYIQMMFFFCILPQNTVDWLWQNSYVCLEILKRPSSTVSKLCPDCILKPDEKSHGLHFDGGRDMWFSLIYFRTVKINM